MIGAAVRGVVAALDRLGVGQEIRGAVSPEARQLLDSPPVPIVWVDSALADELILAALRLRDWAFVRQVGYEATRESAGPVVLPMIRIFLSMSGGSPATIFSNLHRLIPVEIRGLESSYEKLDDRSGILELRYCERVPDVSFAVWEGTLLFAYDICKVQGQVEKSQLLPGGAAARIKLSW